MRKLSHVVLVLASTMSTYGEEQATSDAETPQTKARLQPLEQDCLRYLKAYARIDAAMVRMFGNNDGRTRKVTPRWWQKAVMSLMRNHRMGLRRQPETLAARIDPKTQKPRTTYLILTPEGGELETDVPAGSVLGDPRVLTNTTHYFVAPAGDTPSPYVFYCVNKETGKTQWSVKIDIFQKWGFTGVGMHRLEVVDAGDELWLLGASTPCVYVAVIDKKTRQITDSLTMFVTREFGIELGRDARKVVLNK